MQNETLSEIFGTQIRKPKSVKISKAQLEKHKQKYSISPEQKAEIIKAQEIRQFGKEARIKRARKQDMREALIEKGVRPKGRYYDLTPLEQICGVDIVTPEAQDEARIIHFGGHIKD